MSTPGRREGASRLADCGGVLLSFRDDEERCALAFIPASVATRLTALTCLIEVPGVKPPARGLALADGEVLTVLELCKVRAPSPTTAYLPGADWPVPGSDRAVLCVLGSIRVALTGGTVVATGMFDATDDGSGVLWRGECVPTLDVRALYARAETAIWADRAAVSRLSSRPDAPSPRIPRQPRTTTVPPRSPAKNGDR